MPEIVCRIWKVTVIESDSFSGQKVIDTRFFTSEKEANDFAQPINAKNNKAQTPDYYIFATVNPC